MVVQRFCFGGKANRQWIDAFVRFTSQGDLYGRTHKYGIHDVEAYEYAELLFIVVHTQGKEDWGQLQTTLSNRAHDKETAFLGQLLENPSFSVLDRIFTKNKVPELKKPGTYKRTAMALRLKRDPLLLKAYREIHAPNKIWPQILDNMDAMGIQDMELYLMDHRAFLLMDTPPNFDLEKEGLIWAQLPRETEWQQYVSKFQDVDPHSKAMEKWNEMKRI